VAPATRRRVEAVIRSHGYQKPVRAGRRAPLLELIFHELESEWALEIVRGVERVAGRHQLAVVLTEMQGRRRPGQGWIEGALARRPMGVIAVFSDLSETMRDQLHTRGIPFVVVDPAGEPLHDTPSIGATNWNGGLAATRHLLGLGHRRIGMLAGRPHSLAGSARLHGYRAALQEAGIPVDPALIKPSDFDFAEAVAAAAELLALPDPPTAIFAASDAQALGVLDAARRAGRRVPEDLSLVSFDDTAIASMAAPPLTVVRQPFEEMGRAAVRTLIDLAEGRAAATPRMELTTQLVVRESTAALR
jgi:DNA-binding LacI/PurR family transcriptional regulator